MSNELEEKFRQLEKDPKRAWIISVTIRLLALSMLFGVVSDWQEGGIHIFSREFYHGVYAAYAFYGTLIPFFLFMLFIPLRKSHLLFTNSWVFALFAIPLLVSITEEVFPMIEHRYWSWSSLVTILLTTTGLSCVFWMHLSWRRKTESQKS